jgi:hypothetical protein
MLVLVLVLEKYIYDKHDNVLPEGSGAGCHT